MRVGGREGAEQVVVDNRRWAGAKRRCFPFVLTTPRFQYEEDSKSRNFRLLISPPPNNIGKLN